MHFFILLLLRGAILCLYSLKMSGKVREFDHEWRVATLNVIEFGGNREPVYDFLLVINSNLCPILNHY